MDIRSVSEGPKEGGGDSEGEHLLLRASARMRVSCTWQKGRA